MYKPVRRFKSRLLLRAFTDGESWIFSELLPFLVIFSLAQVRHFWCPWFSSCLTLGIWHLNPISSTHPCVVTLDSSLIHFLWRFPEFLNWLYLGILSVLWSFLFLVLFFLLHFLPSSQLSINMFWYRTLWNVSPFNNEPLWLTEFH